MTHSAQDVVLEQQCPAPPPAAPRRPVTDDTVTQYMKTREVFQHNSTSVLVDAFRYTAHYRNMKQLAQELSGGNPYDSFGCIFFLSHYHSDHYTGLHPGWNHGTVFTGEVTGALLTQHLGLPQERVVTLKRGVTHRISLATRSLMTGNLPLPFQASYEPQSSDELAVTLLDANHCPGADMIVMRHAVFGTILHTGDFRFNGTSASLATLGLSQRTRLGNYDFVGENPILTQIAGQVKKLFLDNTFCDPSFKFEPQEAAFQHVVNVVKDAFVNQYHRKYSESTVVVTAGDDDMENIKGTSIMKCKCCSSTATQERKKKCVHVAVLVGTYTIGKERIALALQRAFKGVGGAVPPIVVSEQKQQLLQLTDFADSGFVQTPSSMHREASASDNKFKAIEADFVETELDIISLCDTSGADGTSKQLFGLKQLVDESVSCFLTLFLVPLQVLSYRNLSTCLSNDITPTPNGVNFRPPRTIFLWDRCYLPVDSFDVIVCIEPTGWASPKAQQKPKYISRKFELTSVPYSEHSSFTELLEFVKFIRPEHIVPTVSLEQYIKQEPLFLEACGKLRTLSGAAPLSKFAHLFRKPTYVGELVDATLYGGSKKQVIPSFELTSSCTTTNSIQKESNDHAEVIVHEAATVHATTIEENEKPRKRPRVVSHHHRPTVIDEDSDEVIIVSATPICIELD